LLKELNVKIATDSIIQKEKKLKKQKDAIRQKSKAAIRPVSIFSDCWNGGDLADRTQTPAVFCAIAGMVVQPDIPSVLLR
jgi:hypothetical protein